MAKAKTSKNLVKSSMAKKPKVKPFSIKNVSLVELNGRVSLERHHPAECFKDVSRVQAALLEALLDGDSETFKEILSAFISVQNKSAVAKKVDVTKSTMFRMLKPGSNPTLNNIAKVMKVLKAS